MGRSTLISLNTTEAHIQTPSRMNKLLMLTFLVTLMGLMATAAPQEEVEEHELEDLSADEINVMEEVAESREEREAAGRKKRPSRMRSTGTNNPRKPAKKTKKKVTIKGKDKLRKKRPSRMRSTGTNNPRKPAKKPKQKVSIKGKGRNANRQNARTNCRADRSDYTCLLNAMNYLGLMKTQVANYLRQQGRIAAANKTGEKKNGKKGIFASTAQRIIRSGGGDSSALSCQGSTTSNGAKNLTALAALLNGCAVKVKAACATENMPLPNMTEVMTCATAMDSFKSMVETCTKIKENGTDACTCWSNSNFTALETTIRSNMCKGKDAQSASTAQLKACRGNFSACKQAEDDGMKAMSSCATSKADLLASAKTLTANSAGLDAAKTKVDSLAGNGTRSPFFAAAAAIRAAESCAEIITIVTEIKTIVAANPENSTVTTLTTKITSVASTVTCSDAEKTSLATSSSDLAAAKESVDGSLATINEDIEIASGSPPTDEEISSATTASSATAASSARRNIVARHLLNRFNLN